MSTAMSRSEYLLTQICDTLLTVLSPDLLLEQLRHILGCAVFVEIWSRHRIQVELTGGIDVVQTQLPSSPSFSSLSKLLYLRPGRPR